MMKKTIFLLSIIPFLLTACKKDPDIKAVFEIESEVVETYTSSVEIMVKYSYNADLKYVKALLSEDVEMTAPMVSTASLNGRVFVVKFVDLQANTKYYYQYEYSNGVDVARTEVKSFKTMDYSQPVVQTVEVFDITATSARCNANVIDNGGLSITERGVCWSSQQTPTVNDTHVTSIGETGQYTCEITGLADFTNYYVRAYAVNDNGICYGEQITFTTDHVIVVPTLTTNDITFIKDVSAVSGGDVTSDGYGTISAKGICWSQSENPTTDDAHTLINAGDLGSFQSQMTGLTANTTYYVRAYATNEAGTGYGEQRVFTTSSPINEGALNGVFTAGEKQVVFSQGNLQYQPSSNTWRFAANQFDFVGEENKYISSYYNGWIDLFGWGTSGYNHGAVCWQPWSVSTTDGDYFAYGESEYNLYDQSGKADWGYNPIANGENTSDQWRTLTSDEWDYIVNIRYTESGIRFAKARVNNVDGMILLPDNWSASIYELSYTNSTGGYYTSNTINLTTWINILEANGAVFLPAAGYREGTNYYYYTSSTGCYWSSSYKSETQAYSYYVGNSGGISSVNRNSGRSVRLVRDVE